MRITIPTPVRVAAVAVLLSGCATPTRTTGYKYPPPPDKTRVVHVRTFSKPGDLPTSFLRRAWNILVPHDSTAAILNPTGIALSPDEKRLYVACPPRGRVIEIDLDAGTFDAIGNKGGEALARPVGVAVDSEGMLYVTDKGDNSVKVYDRDGKFERKFGRDLLVQPTALAVDRRRQLVYVVSDATSKEGKHAVQVFSLTGKHLRTIGGRGRGEPSGYFNFPSSLAVSPAGELYVADMLNFRIQVFDPNGNFLRMFGEAGKGAPGLFDKVRGMAFDTFNNLYAVDVMQGIEILNDRNRGLMTFGMGAAQIPVEIVVDSRNRIFVTDFNDAIHEFQLVNTTKADSYEAAPPTSSDSGPASAPATPAGKALQ